MAAVLESQHLHWTCTLFLNRFDLRHGSVLIVEALDDQHRARDPCQVFFNVPVAEVGMEPDVVPSPESPGWIAVIAAKAFRQIGGLEAYLGLADAADAQILDKNVRREQNGSAQAIVSSGVDDCDGGAIAVADEDRVFNVQSR